LESLTTNTILAKEYSQNQIYSTLISLQKDGYIFTGYNGRFYITEKGKQLLLSKTTKFLKYLENQWIAIIALIISILVFIFK